MKLAQAVKAGDKIKRFGHFHPVVSVAAVVHPLTASKVVEITHDLGKVCFMPDALLDVIDGEGEL
jgi:hypothetical protein